MARSALLFMLASASASSSISSGADMRAFVAPSSDPATYYFDPAFPVPSLGKLHDELAELPEEAKEVKLKVLCSSVNPADMYSDEYLKPKPLGSDVVGVVVETESDVFGVGAIVWGDIGSNAKLGTDANVTTKELGAYAEYAVALDTQLALAPTDSLPVLELCSLPKVALTMYKAMTWYAGGPWSVASNKTVLVLGCSGGTGSAGVQLAKSLGAGTIAGTTSAENFEYCEGLGASQLIDYHSQNWWDVFDEGEVDVLIDTVGEAGTPEHAFSVLSPHGGHGVSIADFESPGSVPAGMTWNTFINSDTNLVSAREMEALSELVVAGKLSMPSLSIYGLAQVAEAFETSAGGHVRGKLVISVTNDTSV